MKNKKSKANWHTKKKESEEGKVKEREDKECRKFKELRTKAKNEEYRKDRENK